MSLEEKKLTINEEYQLAVRFYFSWKYSLNNMIRIHRGAPRIGLSENSVDNKGPFFSDICREMLDDSKVIIKKLNIKVLIDAFVILIKELELSHRYWISKVANKHQMKNRTDVDYSALILKTESLCEILGFINGLLVAIPLIYPGDIIEKKEVDSAEGTKSDDISLKKPEISGSKSVVDTSLSKPDKKISRSLLNDNWRK